jgi:hypothetical protein
VQAKSRDPWRNAAGKVAAHPANARQTSPTNTGTHLGDETQSKGEAAQRSGSNDVYQLAPIRLGASAREYDFSGYMQAVGGANPLKKALNRHNFNSGRWRVFHY